MLFFSVNVEGFGILKFTVACKKALSVYTDSDDGGSVSSHHPKGLPKQIEECDKMEFRALIIEEITDNLLLTK